MPGVAGRVDERRRPTAWRSRCGGPSARRRPGAWRRTRRAMSMRLACTSSIDVPSSRAISPGCGVMTMCRSSRPDQPSRVVVERQHGVGVEHERHRRPLDQRAHERARAGAPRPARARRRSRPAAAPAPRPPRPRPPRRPASRPAARSCIRRPATATIGWHDAGVAIVTSPAPDAQRAQAGQVRRAGLAARAGHHGHAAVVALVRVGRPRLHEQAHLLRRQQLDRAALRRPSITVVAECRCRRSPRRRRGPRPAAAPASSFGAASVTVIDAETHWPTRCGVSAESPLGRSTDTIGMSITLTSATTVSSSPASGAPRPVPTIASTMSEQRCTSEACSSHALLVGHFHDVDAEAAEDVEVDAGVALDLRRPAPARTPTRRRRAAPASAPPRSRRRRCCRGRTARPRGRRAGPRRRPRCADTTWRPAFSISTSEAMPTSSMVWRSASRICVAFEDPHRASGVGPRPAGRCRTGCGRRTDCPRGRRWARTCGRARTAAGYAAASRE